VQSLTTNSPGSQALLLDKLKNMNDSESSSSTEEGLSQADQEELELSVVRSVRELARSSKDRSSTLGQEINSLKRTQTSQFREVILSIHFLQIEKLLAGSFSRKGDHLCLIKFPVGSLFNWLILFLKCAYFFLSDPFLILS